MSEPMTIEVAVEILNRVKHRVKHRGRCDWQMDSVNQLSSIPRNAPAMILAAPDSLIIAQWYQEREPGRWLWALEQMKSGYDVKRPRHRQGDALRLVSTGPAGELIVSAAFKDEGTYLWLTDLEATDWQIVEENSNE